MQQHHPMSRQPDPTITGREMDQPAQIGITGKRQIIFRSHSEIIDKIQRLKSYLYQEIQTALDQLMKLSNLYLIISLNFDRYSTKFAVLRQNRTTVLKKFSYGKS
jgi:hypothetical protein